MQKPNVPTIALNLDLKIKAVFCRLGEFSADDLTFSQSALKVAEHSFQEPMPNSR